jgi:xylulokinase
MGYLLGYDIGSSSIKASLIDVQSGKLAATAFSPQTEMEISALRPGWAEQRPEVWWEHVKAVTASMKAQSGVNLHDVLAVGISYQMHGLVIVDRNLEVLRPAIIWCDSRAVEIGEKAFQEIGTDVCLRRLLNSPGNFTAAKLKWVMQNEPSLYARTYKAMLPGEYIGLKLTGEIKTTPSGLSEGIFWDFQNQNPADIVFNYFGISEDLLPDVMPVFSNHGALMPQAAAELGLKPGTIVSYRAGDQLNNALSLNVLNPGEIAATAGTSGVVYGVSNKANYDVKSRVNIFAHVNYTSEVPRYGVLLCLNGTGCLNRWLKHNFTDIGIVGPTYEQMNKFASQASPGSKGLMFLPYGNGAERTLENLNIGASLSGLDFNIHDYSHVLRAAQEGIVFALNYGVEIMRGMGTAVTIVKAGNANMFLSALFGEVFASVTGAEIELYNTDGSQGAARGAGIGAGIYRDFPDAFAGLQAIKTIEPNPKLTEVYREVYYQWLSVLEKQLKNTGGIKHD